MPGSQSPSRGQPLLAIDPAIPTVWRSPWSLQFGVDPAVLVLEQTSREDERMIAALETGTTAGALAAIGGDTASARLLERLAPVLITGRPRHPGGRGATTPAAGSPRPEVTVRSAAAGEILAQLALLLPPRRATPEPPTAERTPGLLIVDHAVTPAEHLPWLRADRPHLAVVFGERAAAVGPVVRPGVTACLRCRDLHRRDADPAWPAIASQLIGRPAAAASDALLRATAITIAVGAIANGRGEGAAAGIRIGLDGERRAMPLAPHPECGCLRLG